MILCRDPPEGGDSVKDKDANEEECLVAPISPFRKTPSLIKAIHEEEQKHKQKGIEHYLEQIKEWEYAYCEDCKEIRFSAELEATADGIRCTKCNGYNLEAPGWVVCPHHKDSVVKCARAGRGIVKMKYDTECHDHCNFRLSKGP